MAVLDLNLGGSGTTTISDANAADGDMVNVTALGSHTLIVEDVDITITSIAGVQAAAQPTFVAGMNGSITLDQGLLNVAALTGMNFEIAGNGDVTLDGSTLGLLGSVTNLLNDYTVNFSGGHVGTFTYSPPALGVLDAISFEVTDMQAGDQFIIDDSRIWSLDTTLFGPPESAYRGGMLHLTSGGGLLGQTVDVQIQMDAAEAAIFFGNVPFYLNAGVFTFPGTVLCYGDGALVLTEGGYRTVESLVVGDRLRCADGHLRTLIWKAATVLDAGALDLRPELRPVRIAAGALANGYPFADLVVSPQHRIFVNGEGIRQATGGDGGLMAVKHLVGLPGITHADWGCGVRYHHLLLSEHEILVVNGVMSESLLLGPWSMRNLDARTRKSLQKLLPEFSTKMTGGDKSRHALLKGHVARQVKKRFGLESRAFFDPVGARATAMH